MFKTQDHLPIVDVKDDVAVLRNGDLAIVLETSAVNFGLLSAGEQYAIISAFAGMLNSLSFSIQIVIRSKRLDITDYLKLLDESMKQQTNPLLGNMMVRYRNFIERTVTENEVLDKQFYVVISISYLETGITKSSTDDTLKKGLTLLLPRRDHIIRQLARIGLKANQLNHNQLVRLFYDIYNFDPDQPVSAQIQPTVEPAAQLEAAPVTPRPQAPVMASPPAPVQPPSAQPVAQQPLQQPTYQAQPAPQPANSPYVPPPVRRASPFVVEELQDDYSNVNR